MKSFKYIYIFLFFVIGVGLFGVSASLINSKEPDAIAVRVFPNPTYMSPDRWYQAQGFRGSPQSLEVDGYQAIRDGRTVYVNAANIIGVCSNNVNRSCSTDIECQNIDEDDSIEYPNASCNLNDFYTNIYVIAQNVDAHPQTNMIFNEILGRIRFNTNITEVGTCSIGQADCEGLACKVCVRDNECSDEVFCDSEKAQVTRDTRRLADISYIGYLLERYRDEHGHYPILSSGTYLPYTTISVWPSWQDNLARELGVDRLPIDHINNLGECNAANPNADSVTCWDEIERELADQNPNDVSVELPAGSYVYMYVTDPEGRGFNIQ